MPVNYKKLFEVLKSRHLSVSRLSEDFNLSSATRAKFKKNAYISLQTLESICKYLCLSIYDVVTFEIGENPSMVYQRLKEEMTFKMKGDIYHKTQILFTYNSNHIEGSRLTSDQTRYHLIKKK